VSKAPTETGYDPSVKGYFEQISRISAGGPPFNRPTAVAIAANGDMYVSDGYGNTRIHQFTPTGELVRSWGEPGTGPGQFHCPHGIVIDGQGRLLVSDRENERIQLFTPDGQFIEEWSGLHKPCAAAVMQNGMVVVAEMLRHPGEKTWIHGTLAEGWPATIAILDERGRLQRRLGSGERPCSEGDFAAPHGVAIDSRGDIYVSEVTYSMYVWSVERYGMGYDTSVYVADCHQLQKLTRKEAMQTSGVVRMPAPSV
jgi:sugar lactone lactonase YvrE